MTHAPRWIDQQALMILHEESLAQFGGARGLRDSGLLESALARPENKFLYEPETGLYLLAAAYCFGIARNHPFIDGNKRTALLAVIVFLGLNGYRLAADALELERAILQIAAGTKDETQLAEWLAEHTIRATA